MTASRLLATLALALCIGLGALAPPAFAAAPALKLTATSQPTNFIPGSVPLELKVPDARFERPQYSFIATNVGSAPTSGPITFKDTLPPGLTPTRPAIRDFNFFFFNTPLSNPNLTCSVSGQEVTCIDPEPLQPGQFAQVFIPVKVAPDAGPTATHQASVVGGGAGEATTEITTTISESLPSFDYLADPNGLSAAATGPEGMPATQAGSHPGQLTIDLALPSRDLILSPKEPGSLFSAGGHLRDLSAHLPRGMAVNPNASPVRCTETQLETPSVGCPDAAAIGTATVTTDLGVGAGPAPSALYNMVAPPGVPAELAFDALGLGIFVHLQGRVNSAGEYELGSDAKGTLAREVNPILGAQVQLWGDPSDAAHDAMRGGCASVEAPSDCENALPERSHIALLAMPSSCRSSLTVSAAVTSWEEPSVFHERSVELEDSLGNPVGTDGCNALDFDPTISAQPTTNVSDAPTGLDFNIHVPQTEKFEDLATANFRDVKVDFPPGMVVNPSSANGLGACSMAQIGYTPREGKIRFDENPAQCPDSAKIGSVEVSTPLLDHPLPGDLYVAQPIQNPFGSFLAIYLAVYDEETGVVSKLAGKVETDPNSGQITTTFKENPELPIEDVRLSVFGGPRAALKTSLPCGNYSILSTITPWSTPEGATVTRQDSFATNVAAAGSGACPTSEATAPHKPSFSAGTITPQAGTYSPFVLKLSREDGSQRLTGVDTILPKGLVAKLAGVPYCQEAQIAVAKSREAPTRGALEQLTPSCPAASEVGTINVGAGAGPTPFYAQGHVYLAGPYKGAPLSFVIITPAVAGPFDLGAVVSRVALQINSETAEVRAVSDPLPTILQGIPLDLRSVALKIDRPNFTLNPTSCEPKAVTANATAASDQSAALSVPFQVGDCKRLKFAPKLAISLKGGTKRTKFPALKAVLTYPKKGAYANIAKAQVTLPHSAFLEQAHIRTICTRVQFAADQCPKGSIYGFAKAFTPLFDKPVEGPVYLRSSSHELPDLVAALNGQVDVDLVGRVDTGKGGGIRNTFEAAPDAPVSKFILELKGGKKGLFVNSENICSKPQRAIADFTAQNGKVHNTTPLIANSCKGKAKPKKGR